VINSLTSETSYANVAEEAELGSKNTAADYLSFLGGSFFLNELLFYSIPQKRVVLKKNKKYYPTDPFFLWIFQAFVTGNNDIERFYEQYLTSPLSTQLAENFIASELYKERLDSYFFKNSKELDFYIPSLGLGIEVKYKERIVSQDLTGLKPAKHKVLVSKQTLERRGDIVILPVWLFGLVEWREFDWG
jgi:predicted AAA+ superfamily ATPase